MLARTPEKNNQRPEQGCQIFLGTTYQKQEKIYLITVKYTEWTLNIPNGHKIYQHLPLPDPSKFTQIVFWV
jgi:hypothetical protein